MTETIYDVARTILATDPASGKATTDGALVTDGMTPNTRVPLDEGLHWLTPEQAMAVHIDRVTVTDTGVTGYQRTNCNIAHARRIARAMETGEPIPPVLLARNGNGHLHAADGQHRLVAAIIAKQPVRATVVNLDEDAQRRLFASQGKHSRINPSVIALTGDNPAQKYVQRICVQREGEWADLVSAAANVNYITPSQAYRAVLAYVTNNLVSTGAGSQNWDERISRAWDTATADELGVLLRAVGTRRTNPEAFRSHNLRALVACAVLTVRRNDDHHQKAITRWKQRMPGFPFADYRHLHTHSDVLPELARWWNRNLSHTSPFRV